MRVILNGAWGFASGVVLTPEAAVQVAENAVRTAQVAAAMTTTPVALAPEPVIERVIAMAQELDRRERFVWNKLITGAFRVGASARLVERALEGQRLAVGRLISLVEDGGAALQQREEPRDAHGLRPRHALDLGHPAGRDLRHAVDPADHLRRGLDAGACWTRARGSAWSGAAPIESHSDCSRETPTCWTCPGPTPTS